MELTWLDWNRLFGHFGILPGSKTFFFLCTGAKVLLILLVMGILLESRFIRTLFGYQKKESIQKISL